MYLGIIYTDLLSTIHTPKSAAPRSKLADPAATPQAVAGIPAAARSSFASLGLGVLALGRRGRGRRLSAGAGGRGGDTLTGGGGRVPTERGCVLGDRRCVQVGEGGGGS